MASYKVTLIHASEGLSQTIDGADGQSILDAAGDQGLDLPFSCRAGSCASKLISGSVNQDDQFILSEDQIAAGFVLSCVAMPSSDCTIETYAEAAGRRTWQLLGSCFHDGSNPPGLSHEGDRGSLRGADRGGRAPCALYRRLRKAAD